MVHVVDGLGDADAGREHGGEAVAGAGRRVRLQGFCCVDICPCRISAASLPHLAIVVIAITRGNRVHLTKHTRDVEHFSRKHRGYHTGLLTRPYARPPSLLKLN